MLLTAAAVGFPLAVPVTPAAADPADSPVANHVVVVGVSGLIWTDVTESGTPVLAGIVARGSVGVLSIRSAPQVTCPAEGWLTLGAGTYAAVADPDRIDPAQGCAARAVPTPLPDDDDAGARIPRTVQTQSLNSRLRFGARPGMLGARMPCAAAVGPGAALGVADPAGRVDVYAPDLPAELGAFLTRCRLTAIDLGELPADRPARRDALRAVDAALARIQASRPSGTTLIVAGLAETDPGTARLHVGVVDGPGFRGGWLRSPSTRRLPYAQLVDLAPTALNLLGFPSPADLAGRPWRGQAPGRPADLAATTAALADIDAASVAQREVVPPFFLGFGVLSLVVYGALTLLTRSARLTRSTRRDGARGPAAARGRHQRALAMLGVAAVGLAAVPGATYLAHEVPWWRAPSPLAAVAAATLVAAALATAVACLPPWGRTPVGRFAAVCAISVAVVGVNVVLGGDALINSLLGESATVAGRFSGVGNVIFGVFGAASVLLAALVAYGRPRRVAWAILAAVAVPVVLVDGLPAWGADLGGVLTLVPAFGVLALLLADARITVARMLALACGAVAVVGVIAVADYLRPEGSRSHFGRFVASVLDGGADSTLERKLRTSLDLLFTGPHTVAAVLVAALFAVAVFRPPAALRAAYAASPPLRTALVAAVAFSAVGFVTNDSGVAVPVLAGMLALPLALAVSAWTLTRGPGGGEPPGGEGAEKSSDTPVPEIGRAAEVLP